MRTLLIWIFAVFWSALWASLSVLSSLVDKSGKLGFNCMKNWGKGLFKISGVKLEVEGFEKIPQNRNYIFVSNHQSQVDIIALSAGVPIQFGWMAKKSLFKIPFMGWHMKRMGYVAVERSSRKSATQSLFNASKALKKGFSLFIFPEGTRSKDGMLKAFKDGAFYLAIETQTPIVTVVVKGTRDIIKKGSSKVNRGEVRIKALGMINVDKYSHSDRDKLKKEVRGNIEANL